jgi:hypothetical protein
MERSAEHPTTGVGRKQYSPEPATSPRSCKPLSRPVDAISKVSRVLRSFVELRFATTAPVPTGLGPKATNPRRRGRLSESKIRISDYR